MGDKLIIHTEEMRDKVRVPAMYSLILVRSFSFPISQTYRSVSLFLSFFSCSHVKLMKATRGTYSCRVHRIQSKPFKLNWTRTYSPNKYPIICYNFTDVHGVWLVRNGMVWVWRNIYFQLNTSWSIFFRGT